MVASEVVLKKEDIRKDSKFVSCRMGGTRPTHTTLHKEHLQKNPSSYALKYPLMLSFVP